MDAPVDFFEQPQEPESVEEAPEPHANGRGRGRNGRGRGGRQGGNDRGSGSRGKGPNKRATASTCICPNCTAPKYPGSRFCSLFHHKKNWDNMLYQRKTRSITKEQAEAFDERMRIDHEAGKEVAQFALDNPPELKKKGLVDFQRFVRIRGQRVATCQQDGTKPYTYAAFIKYAENHEGLSEEEGKEMWNEFYRNKAIERDNLGWRGAERLWVPVHQLKMNDRQHYVDNQVQEGSDEMRAPTLEDRQMLKDPRTH